MGGNSNHSRAESASERPKILIVEDDLDLRTLYSVYLRATWDVFTAADGAEGIKHLTNHSIDVLFTDLRLPGMDGIELISWTRERYPKTRALLVTGHADSDHERIQNLKIRVLSKPVPLDTLDKELKLITH